MVKPCTCWEINLPRLILVVVSFPSRDLSGPRVSPSIPFFSLRIHVCFREVPLPQVMHGADIDGLSLTDREGGCSAMTCVGVGKGTEGEGRINGKEHGRAGEIHAKAACRRCFPALPAFAGLNACHVLGGAHSETKAQLKSISLAFYCCSVPAPAPVPAGRAASCMQLRRRPGPGLACPYSLGSTLLNVYVHSISMGLAGHNMCVVKCNGVLLHLCLTKWDTYVVVHTLV